MADEQTPPSLPQSETPSDDPIAPPDASAVEPTVPAEPAAPTETDVPAADAAAEPTTVDDDQAAIDQLLQQANFEDPSSVTTLPPAPEAAPFELANFQQAIADAQVSSIDLLRDVELNVKIELGRSRMVVEDVLKLGEGSVVELDKLAGDPVDVFVNDRLVARGEVLVLNDNFCVRVNEIVASVKEEGL